MDNYDEIIMLDHHVSKTRAPMNRKIRAAQFAPFAALTGYEECIGETGRRVESKIIPDEDAKEILDRKLSLLSESNEKIKVTYFIPDGKKQGGKYVTAEDFVEKSDTEKRILVMKNGTEIAADDIIDIQSDIFDNIQ